jgi:two-component system OmpR family response regulator
MPYRLPHTARILVVEDQHTVRQIVVRCLRAAGYEVLEAGNGEEALAVLESDLQIDMVVTDVRMPEMGGLRLAERLTLTGRSPLLLFISGYGPDPSTIPGPLLEKPFGPDELVSEVRRLLSQAAAHRRDEGR